MTKRVFSSKVNAKIITSSPRVAIKNNLSKFHLKTAQLFADRCKLVEDEDSALEWPQPRYEELKSYASASIMMSVASLEASINELFLEAIDRSKNSLEPLSAAQMTLLAELWKATDRSNALSKYQIVLTACGKSPFETGKPPFKEAKLLTDLRNALVHFKPEWDDELKEHRKLEAKLKGRFNNNRLSEQATGRMTWFPNKCLGAGAARWAITTTIEFSAQFCQELGIKKRLGV